SIHSRYIEIPHLAGGSSWDGFLVSRGRFENFTDEMPVSLAQLFESTPAGLVGGNGVVPQPFAGGKPVKVVTGFYRPVHVVDGKSWHAGGRTHWSGCAARGRERAKQQACLRWQ